MRTLTLCALLALCGCSAVLKFEECKVDSDCAENLYCTNDRLCIDHVPDERLCQQKIGAVGNPDALVIGALARVSLDPPSELDVAMVQSVQLAVEEINQRRPVVVVVCDTGKDGEQAVRALEIAVTQHRAVGFVGPTTSGLTLAAAPAAVKHGVVLISPSATSPAITDLVDEGLVWRTAASDLLQARVLAEEVQPSTDVLDTFYANTAYGTDLNNSFIAAWGARTAALGMPRVPANTFIFDEGAIPPEKIIQMAADMPKEALLIADPDAPALVQAVANAGPGLAATQFLMADAAKGTTLFGADPAAIVSTLARIRGTGPGRPADPMNPSTPIYNTFRAAYKDRFDADPQNTSFVANAYDAAYLLAIAASAGGPIRDNLSRVSKAMPTVEERISIGPTQFNKALAVLQSGGEIDLLGASGPIDFTVTGDVVTGSIEVWGIDVSVPSAPKFVTLRERTP